jgi:phosphoribosylformylglycinamidine synthase
MSWTDGDEIWLLGEPAWDPGALAAAELAWRRGRFGGQPSLDLLAAANLVSLLSRLSGDGTATGAHDISVGGLGVALARMAIASGVGATIRLPEEAESWPTASLFGERGGRVLVAAPRGSAAAMAAAAGAARVPAQRLGSAEGLGLNLAIDQARISLGLDQLQTAWRTAF